jgi:SAM-dependent methyltransferase
LKPYLKYIIYKLQLAKWLDAYLFHKAQTHNSRLNQQYHKQNPGIILPPDYDLYETFQLNYQKFIEDGSLAAKEIIEWTKPYSNTTQPRILDWGCGVGRVTRHITTFEPGALVYGCDINEHMIEWDKKNYHGISFSIINNFTPTLYAPCFFDLIYGLSIFTHIKAAEQQEWIMELHRILKPEGILLVTTQGSKYEHKLLFTQKRKLQQDGMYTQTYLQEGHRMMSTYHKAAHFRKIITPLFTVLAYYDGSDHPEKAGGQDLWILQKRTF